MLMEAESRKREETMSRQFLALQYYEKKGKRGTVFVISSEDKQAKEGPKRAPRNDDARTSRQGETTEKKTRLKKEVPLAT